MIRAGALVLLVATVAPQAARAEETPATEQPEEIVVYGRSMATLRNERYRAEERVFAIFNSLNSDDEYDIHCEYRAPIGSLIKERVCEANFVGIATAAEAYAAMMGRSPVPAWPVIRRKEKLLLDEMKMLAVAHPELLEALEELADVGARTEYLKEERRTAKRE